MPKRPETRRPPLTGADGEVRELTKADIARMRTAGDVLPAKLRAVLPKPPKNKAAVLKKP